MFFTINLHLDDHSAYSAQQLMLIHEDLMIDVNLLKSGLSSQSSLTAF